jgi:hypothetical protein
MLTHLARILGLTALLAAGMVYPFLPGRYDSLAVALSTLAQSFGTAGLLVVPIGLLWLADEVRQRARRKRALPTTQHGYYFGLAALIVASILGIAASFLIFLGLGVSLSVLALALWGCAVASLWPKLRRLKRAPAQAVNPAPLYLTVIPLAALLFQVALAAPATAFSRSYAITRSAELIAAIEQHREEYGRYPGSLIATWPDYYPSVVGIPQYHYAPNGNAYNLVFEQPLFLFHNLGAREFVVYNPLDEHVIASHAAWILLWSPEELAVQQGWFAVHEASVPHWRYFWFD